MSLIHDVSSAVLHWRWYAEDASLDGKRSISRRSGATARRGELVALPDLQPHRHWAIAAEDIGIVGGMRQSM